MRGVWIVLFVLCANPVFARSLSRIEALALLREHPLRHDTLLEGWNSSPLEAIKALLALQEYSAATLEPSVGEAKLPARAPLAHFLAVYPEGVQSPVWRHARDFAFEWYLLKLISDLSEKALDSGASPEEVNALLKKSYQQTGRALLLLEGAIEQTKHDDNRKIEIVQQMLAELGLAKDPDARTRFGEVLRHADSSSVRAQIVHDVDHSRMDRIRYGVVAFVSHGVLHSMLWTAGFAVFSAIFQLDAQTVSTLMMAAGGAGVVKGATTGVYLAGFPEARADLTVAQAPLRYIDHACRVLFKITAHSRPLKLLGDE